MELCFGSGLITFSVLAVIVVAAEDVGVVAAEAAA
jgi:hypothetical protein